MLRPLAPVVLLASVLVLTACGSDEPTGSPSPELSSAVASPRASAAPSTAPSSAPSSEPEPSVSPDDAQVVALTVAGGEVTGDSGRAEVGRERKVRLTVTSDVADEVHVHGFDLSLAVTPGQAAQLEFVADRPGIFEVELHDARQVLTRLQVS